MARVVVGMSGGVDSSVAALLLHRAGHEVIGAFMNNWEEKDPNGVCTSERDWADVRHVCEHIGIPYYSVNFAKEYRERVFEHFLEEYRRGRTPNPDVLCNREIKFNVFLDFAEKLGADKLATGHFAGIREPGAAGATQWRPGEAPACDEAELEAEARIERAENEYQLLRARDENKDQTYFLYMINQRALSMAAFPVGNLLKGEIREIARETGIPVSEKKDSTGVCFIGERNFKEFLSNYLPAQPGAMVTTGGQVVGRHDGLMYYTLGQRRGLGIGGSGDGRRWFVVQKDLKNNVLVVEQGEDSPLLYSEGAIGEAPTWLAGHPPVPEGARLRCTVRLRHRQPLQDCVITRRGALVEIAFDTPQRAVTPGQSAVFYLGRVCLGGVIIQ